jgi:hypothetical protein
MGKGCCCRDGEVGGGFGGGVGWVRDRCGLGSLGSPLAADFSAAEMALGNTY